MVRVRSPNRKAPASCGRNGKKPLLAVLTAGFALAFFVVLLKAQRYPSDSIHPKLHVLEKEIDRGQTPPKVMPRREMIHDRDVLWAEPRGQVSGILFVAHGCSHSNTDWFIECDGCIGLPEERAIVDIGLEFGLLVVAISSTNRRSKCWQTEIDVEPVGKILKTLSDRYHLESKPIVAFGASSGGAFVSEIATPIQLKFGISVSAFISQIAAAADDEMAKCRVYITMDRDERTRVIAEHLVANGLSRGIETRHLQLPPVPITKDFFTRIPEINLNVSSRMATALQNAEFLDENNYLRMNPRRSEWRDVLTAVLSPEELNEDTLQADLSAISEVMNVAHGEHEMTRDGVREALEFCLG